VEKIDVALFENALIGTADPELVEAEARIRTAQLSGDLIGLDDLIDEDLLFTGPDGNLGTKAQDLDAYRSGMIKFRVHEPRELRIRRVGRNVAITSLLAWLVVEVAGNTTEGMYRYTRVWDREHGSQWRVVGGHVSQINQQRIKNA
jgi:ketosteroid isomerase-like protein